MNKLLLICCWLFAVIPFQASGATVDYEGNYSLIIPAGKDPRVAALEKKLGRRMTIREKIIFKAAARKLNRKEADPEAARKNGVISLMAGIGSFVFLATSATAPLTPFLALIAIVFGLISLHGKKTKNTPAVAGLALGSGYVILVFIALATLKIIL